MKKHLWKTERGNNKCYAPCFRESATVFANFSVGEWMY